MNYWSGRRCAQARGPPSDILSGRDGREPDSKAVKYFRKKYFLRGIFCENFGAYTGRGGKSSNLSPFGSLARPSRRRLSVGLFYFYGQMNTRGGLGEYTLDQSEWLTLVRTVVNRIHAGGLPRYIQRDDVEQECLIAIPSALSRFESRNGASVTTYLSTVIRNAALNFLRNEKRARGCGPAMGDRYPDPPDRSGLKSDRQEFRQMISNGTFSHRPEICVGESAEQRAARYLLLDVLTEKQLEALQLKHMGYTEIDSAEIMGTSVGAIKSFRRKGLAALLKASQENISSQVSFVKTLVPLRVEGK